MSCLINDHIIEGLADEYYDDPMAAKDWLVNICHVSISGLHDDQILDLYVQCSMDRMQDGPL